MITTMHTADADTALLVAEKVMYEIRLRRHTRGVFLLGSQVRTVPVPGAHYDKLMQDNPADLVGVFDRYYPAASLADDLREAYWEKNRG